MKTIINLSIDTEIMKKVKQIIPAREVSSWVERKFWEEIQKHEDKERGKKILENESPL